MKPSSESETLDALWAHHHAELRDPHKIVSQWSPPGEVDPALLKHRVRGRFWDVLEETGQTLLVTREYEHLVIALNASQGKPRVTYLRLPHPNGLAIDGARGVLYIASTRNPNLVYEFAPCIGEIPRDGTPALKGAEGTLLPVRSRYLPGCLYIHDIALIGGKLHANAVSMNAIVELPESGGFRRVWWPRCISNKSFGRNYLQLNSIAAGPTLEESFFSASAEEPSARRPGHLNFPVDKRGVIFSGRTRGVFARGLTRPHSARLIGKAIWVDNSGYGEVGRISGERFDAIAKLPGWTRGLCAWKGLGFAGSSRVIPRFRHYAPGVDLDKSRTGVHALDLKTGRILGSIEWPLGNQIFALELSAGLKTLGFPFGVRENGNGKAARKRIQQIFFMGSAQR